MTRMTLPELNALDTISWHSDEAGGVTRTLSDFQHWNGGIEFTIVWDFDALPDDDTEYNHQTQHVRISLDDEGKRWWLRSLEEPHGASLVAPGIIDTQVIDRIRREPNAFAQGAPTRRFAVAFYRGDI